MKASLSPERYLHLSIPVLSPRTLSPVLESNGPDPRPAIMIWGLRSFNGLGSSFRGTLGGLRYKTFEVDIDDLCESDSISKKYLQPVLDVCNRDFLDLESPPLTISLDEWDSSHFGSGSFELGSIVVDQSELFDEELEWRSPGLSRVDWDYDKKCFCVLIRTDPGTIPYEDFLGSMPRTFKSTPFMECLLLELANRCQMKNAAYGIISDEIWTLVLENHVPYRPCKYSVGVFANNKVPLRMTLGAAVYYEIRACGLYRQTETYGFWPCLGALNDPTMSGEPLQSMLQTRRSLLEFDLYTLQRNCDEWRKFLGWKQTVEAGLKGSPLRLGDILRVEVNGFQRRHGVWRSPYPNHPIPDDTRKIVMRAPRSRDNALDSLLARERQLTFEIVEVKRSGPNHYSQVYFGRIGGHDRLVCLKLFEERFFAIPAFSSWDPAVHPALRLEALNFAVDLVRREEGVYEDRLKYLQGSLIPHCYGFHIFTLPDGWEVLGLFMEVIQGPTLYECGFSTWSKDDQTDFITRLRHSVRAMKFASIEQTDWHLDQVLCPVNVTEASRAPEIVFIDFAFAVQDLGQNERVPPTDDTAMLSFTLRGELGVDESIMKACWFRRVEEEY